MPADPTAAFKDLAWARARLWRDGEIEDLHDAVDPLQEWAIRNGLAKAIGQDAVQAIMSQAFSFRKLPDHEDIVFEGVPLPPIPENPDYHLAAKHGAASAEDLQADYEAAIRRRDARPHPGAAASTAEALMYVLRTQGAAALHDKKNLDRLSQISTSQLRDILKRLITLRPKYPAITDELITILGDML